MKEHITLYYRQGTSEKVCQANIEKKGGGYVVYFAYGRRGSTMNTGTKTPELVPYKTAKAIYDKLVNEKTAKGYTPGEDGTPYHSRMSSASVLSGAFLLPPRKETRYSGLRFLPKVYLLGSTSEFFHSNRNLGAPVARSITAAITMSGDALIMTLSTLASHG